MLQMIRSRKIPGSLFKLTPCAERPIPIYLKYTNYITMNSVILGSGVSKSFGLNGE
jgi:hypothetical protein